MDGVQPLLIPSRPWYVNRASSPVYPLVDDLVP